MIRKSIARILAGNDLLEEEAFAAMGDIMDGSATSAQIGALLAALRIKGETIDEIAGCARAMRSRVVRVPVDVPGPLLDTCGTGGDGAGTFNISTAVAFVAAGAGARVAKHGNRSISSKCGSADVLEALGVRVTLDPAAISKAIEEIGLGFLFAPSHHPAMKHAMGPRRELGVRTVFNVLGPLTNPAGATRQLMGVFDVNLVEPLARVLGQLGAERAAVVAGEEGLDELSPVGRTRIARWGDGRVEVERVSAADFGLEPCPVEALGGGDAEENAAIIRAILGGAQGPPTDAVLMNAAVALWAAGIAESTGEGLEAARQALSSGRAAAILDDYASYTREDVHGS